MKKSDVASAAALAAASFYVLYDVSSYPLSVVPGAPGPGAFPRLLAILLLVLAAALCVTGLRRREDEPRGPGWPGVGRSAVALALMAVFWFQAERFDFYALVALLVTALMALMGERRVRMLVPVPLLFGVFVYVVFHRVFGVSFPSVFF